jgi:hypothetical protein
MPSTVRVAPRPDRKRREGVSRRRRRRPGAACLRGIVALPLATAFALPGGPLPTDELPPLPPLEIERPEPIVDMGGEWSFWADPDRPPPDWPKGAADPARHIGELLAEDAASQAEASSAASTPPTPRGAAPAGTAFVPSPSDNPSSEVVLHLRGLGSDGLRTAGHWWRGAKAPFIVRNEYEHSEQLPVLFRAERQRARRGWRTPDRTYIVYPSAPDAQGLIRPTEPDPGLGRLYVHRQFEVPDPERWASLQVTAEFATGLVVYLNGVEVARHHVTPGLEAHAELTTPYWLPDHVNQTAGGRWHRVFLGLPASLLRAGTNSLAVAVHRRETTGDKAMYLDLRLDGYQKPGMIKSPYLQQLEHRQVTVAWETNVPSWGVVEYGTIAGSLEHRAYTPEVASSHHEIVLTDLEPDTPYAYRVRSQPVGGAPSSAESTEIVSEVRGFRTAVPPGTPFTFMAYGDNRTQSEVHAQLIRRMLGDLRAFDARFVVHTGDLVTTGAPWFEWQLQFFEPALPLMGDYPYYTALGNHEGNHESYYHYMALPNNEAWYSFEHGDAEFFALNSSLDFHPGSEQNTWLENALATSTAAWKIAFFHHPPWNCTPSRKPGSRYVQNYLVPLFEAYGVDLVLLGHDHLYGRTNLRNDVLYVISGGGGAPSYRAAPDDINVVCEQVHHYCRVSVEPHRLELKAIDLDGLTVDHVELNRLVNGKNELLSLLPLPFVP